MVKIRLGEREREDAGQNSNLAAAQPLPAVETSPAHTVRALEATDYIGKAQGERGGHDELTTVKTKDGDRSGMAWCLGQWMAAHCKVQRCCVGDWQ